MPNSVTTGLTSWRWVALSVSSSSNAARGAAGELVPADLPAVGRIAGQHHGLQITQATRSGLVIMRRPCGDDHLQAQIGCLESNLINGVHGRCPYGPLVAGYRDPTDVIDDQVVRWLPNGLLRPSISAASPSMAGGSGRCPTVFVVGEQWFVDRPGAAGGPAR